jgi:RNA polymerase sigma-70 factor (ECF subfamily)
LPCHQQCFWVELVENTHTIFSCPISSFRKPVLGSSIALSQRVARVGRVTKSRPGFEVDFTESLQLFVFSPTKLRSGPCEGPPTTEGGNMASSISEAKTTYFATFLPVQETSESAAHERIFAENRHRIYSLAFWMTDSEPEAQEIQESAFARAFKYHEEPTSEEIDRALLNELRERMTIGYLSLQAEPCTEILSVRRNTLRVHLERAIVQLPATERLIFCLHDGEGYTHERIANMLGVAMEESQAGLHQARCRIRELVAVMR